MKTQHLVRQYLKILHRKTGWGEISWTPQYLRVTPNHEMFDPAVADFLLAVWHVDGNTGS